MNKICGYSCEHNKGGICQITRCIKTPLFTTTTEPQVLTRWQDPSIEILKQKVDKQKEILDKIKEYITTIDTDYAIGCWNKDEEFVDVKKDILELLEKIE